MEKTHPYISGPSNIASMIEKLRKAFPSTVTSQTVKKYNLAKNNESSVINTLQFIGVIDDQGNPIEQNKDVFLLAKEEEFQEAFSKLVKSSYSKLFDLHSDAAWTLTDSDLLSFFRATDRTSEAIGKRQVRVFQTLAALSGKIEAPAKRTRQTSASSDKPTTSKPAKTSSSKKQSTSGKHASNSPFDHLGMSIKIEVNLPSDASKETYDNIFKSIRENLIND